MSTNHKGAGTRPTTPRPEFHHLLPGDTGGECGECGFRYAAYRGHLEPCPRCAMEEARHVIGRIMADLLLLDPNWPFQHPALYRRSRVLAGLLE